MQFGFESLSSSGHVQISTEGYSWHLVWSRRMSQLSWQQFDDGFLRPYKYAIINVGHLTDGLIALHTPGGAGFAVRYPDAPSGAQFMVMAENAAINTG